MNITVKDKSLKAIGILDIYDSLLWIERYNTYGEFELYTNADLNLLGFLREDYYLQIKESPVIMIIESINIKTDSEKGNKLIFKGRSLESILDRRIVWTQTSVDSNLDDGLYQIIYNAFILGHSDLRRIIPNFVFEHTVDPDILGIQLKHMFDAENIYDAVSKLCKTNKLGFKIALNSLDQFVFSLYNGKVRSYSQIENPYVVFSPKFDNLINSDYFYNKRYYKTQSLNIGDESGTDALVRNVSSKPGTGGGGSGLDRREIVTDASHLSRYVEGTNTPIDPLLYSSQIQSAGVDNLVKNFPKISYFEGLADTTNSYKYRQDFFLGDVVQIENEYGIGGEARITEVTISENPNGFYINPTFDFS